LTSTRAGALGSDPLLAQRHEVGVVLHEHRDPEPLRQPLAHRVVVPARHDGRRITARWSRRPGRGRRRRPRRPAPSRGRSRPRVRELLLHDGEHGVGPVLDETGTARRTSTRPLSRARRGRRGRGAPRRPPPGRRRRRRPAGRRAARAPRRLGAPAFSHSTPASSSWSTRWATVERARPVSRISSPRVVARPRRTWSSRCPAECPSWSWGEGTRSGLIYARTSVRTRQMVDSY
jgi:hypothetical protein